MLIRIVVILIVKGVCSISIVKVNHPAMLAGLLLVVSLTGSLILGLISCRWLFYLLILVFLGGVIVVLLFMVSICANEKFILGSLRGASLLGVASFLALCGLNTRVGPRLRFSGYHIRLSLYQTDCGIIFLLFMLYLVLCLVRVVRIRKLEAGPLVKRL